MAMPMSAFFRAGESLTPSPVTATILPISWRAQTILYFCSGAMRAKTTSPFSASFSWTSSMAASSLPDITLASGLWMIPIFLAMLSAVSP